jgi:signal transduction histidine kinase
VSDRQATDNGEVTPSGPDQRAATERAVLIGFLTVRSMHLVQGGLCLVTGWSAYRRPRLAAAALCAALVESAWIARRTWPKKAYNEPLPAIVDTGFGLIGLAAIAAATSPDDRTAWLNWVCPLTFGTAAGVGFASESQTSSIAPAALAGVYIATVWPSIRAGGSQLATAVANATSYANYFFAANRFVHRMRRDAESLERARKETLETRARLAAEQERVRQHRIIHDSAIQTLEVVAGSQRVDSDEVRRRARAEVRQLRRLIAGEPTSHAGLTVELEELRDEFRNRGLNVELTIDCRNELSAEVVTALCEATAEALTNVIKHSGAHRAVVRAASDNAGLTVTIRDHGSGFQFARETAGFGISQSIISRMDSVDGRADVWSSPERGTRVELWVPLSSK